MPELLGQVAEPERKCCADCAFRRGSRERSDPYAWMVYAESWDAEGGPFLCHESIPEHPGEKKDGRPRNRVCAGFAATRGLALWQVMALAHPYPEDANG